MDKERNYFFSIEYSYYKIILNGEREIIKLESFSPNKFDFEFRGYIIEETSSEDNQHESEIINVIVYGVQNEKIYFYYTSENICHLVNYDSPEDNSENNLSCKLLENDCFICVFDRNSYMKISKFICYMGSTNTDNCEEKILYNCDRSKFYNAFLYDTLKQDEKIFFAMSDNSETLLCKLINVKTDTTLNDDDLINLELDSTFLKNNCNTKGCDFIYFFAQYLICCSCDNYVSCTRFTLDFNKISEFTLPVAGKNTGVTFLKNNYYLTIIIKNTKGSVDDIYI